MKRFSRSILATVALCVAGLHALCATAAEPEHLAKEAPMPFVDGSFTIVVLPDTQGYAEYFPEIFHAQTAWIAENAGKRNIAFVLHLGDIVDDNNEAQWEVARESLTTLDGVVPYALCIGNHDMGRNGMTFTRDTLFNQYFPLEKYAGTPTFGGVFEGEADRLDNSYHLFSAGGRDFLVLALEFAPRDAVVAWANEVLRAHPDRWGILITHAYLYHDNTLYDWAAKGKKQMWSPHAYKAAKEPGQGNDGVELWRKLVSKHPNMRFVICGHVLDDGLGRLTSEGEAGNPVHQMLVNFQMKPKLGGGFLRLLEFLPDGQTVQVMDYSPVTDEYKTGPDNAFRLNLPAAAVSASPQQ